MKAQAYPSLHLVPSIVDHRRNLLLPSFLTSLTGLGPNDHHIGFSRRLRHEARQDRACILELSLPKGLAKRGCSVNGPRRTECGTCRESTRFVSGLRIRPKGKGMLVKLKGKATDDVYVGPVIALQANKRLRTFP